MWRVVLIRSSIQKALIIHRIDGYIILILLWVATAGALMVARRAYGGDPYTQAGAYLLSLLTLSASSLAYYNIKRLQIDQHRNWMLRAMVYVSALSEIFKIMYSNTANLPIDIIDVLHYYPSPYHGHRCKNHYCYQLLLEGRSYLYETAHQEPQLTVWL